eukprot:15451873-Alexandrium_andersonii.AAC.1
MPLRTTTSLPIPWGRPSASCATSRRRSNKRLGNSSRKPSSATRTSGAMPSHTTTWRRRFRPARSATASSSRGSPRPQ